MMQTVGDLLLGGISPHATCLAWDVPLLTWMISGDLGTAAAYFAISALMLVEMRRQRLLMPSWLLALFSASILLCGLSHLLMVWTLFHSTYWLEAGEKVLTAAVSMLTAVALVFARFATPGGLTANWWRQTHALRHELRNARTVINMLRERSGRLPLIWDDDVLKAPIDSASARPKHNHAEPENKP